MARIDIILINILDALNEEGARDVNPDRILSRISAAQREICQDHLALKAEADITTIAGETMYTLDGQVHKIRQIITPTTWRYPTEIVSNPERWQEILRTVADGGFPKAVTSWNHKLKFHPATPSSGETITTWYYALPSVPVKRGKDPEVAGEWDKVIEAWCIADAIDRLKVRQPDLNSSIWWEKYNTWGNQIAARSLNEQLTAPLKKRHSSDGLGF